MALAQADEFLAHGLRYVFPARFKGESRGVPTAWAAPPLQALLTATDAPAPVWPHPAAEFPSEYDADGAAPILVIGTTNDPATPYSWAVSLANQLSSGVLVTVEGDGHTAYNGDNSCVNDVVDQFFLAGTVPAHDPEC